MLPTALRLLPCGGTRKLATETSATFALRSSLQTRTSNSEVIRERGRLTAFGQVFRQELGKTFSGIRNNWVSHSIPTGARKFNPLRCAGIYSSKSRPITKVRIAPGLIQGLCLKRSSGLEFLPSSFSLWLEANIRLRCAMLFSSFPARTICVSKLGSTLSGGP